MGKRCWTLSLPLNNWSAFCVCFASWRRLALFVVVVVVECKALSFLQHSVELFIIIFLLLSETQNEFCEKNYFVLIVSFVCGELLNGLWECLTWSVYVRVWLYECLSVCLSMRLSIFFNSFQMYLIWSWHSFSIKGVSIYLIESFFMLGKRFIYDVIW